MRTAMLPSSVPFLPPRSPGIILLALLTSALVGPAPILAAGSPAAGSPAAGSPAAGSSAAVPDLVATLDENIRPTIALGSVRAIGGAFPVAGIHEGLIFDQGLDTRCKPRLGPADRNGSAVAGQAGEQLELELGLVGCRTSAEPSITCAWRVYDDPSVRCLGAPPSAGPIFDGEEPRLHGAGTVEGWVGTLKVELPAEVGRYALVLECRDPMAQGARAIPPGGFQWTLYTTLEEPLAWVSPPPPVWYERAACWGRELSAGTDEGKALETLLAGLYRHGAAHWRYGYAEKIGEHHYRFPELDHGSGTRTTDVRSAPDRDEVHCFSGMCRCSWRQLVAHPAVCNFGDCYIFSRAFQGISAVLGIGGLEPLEIYGRANLGFVTPPDARSFDANFPSSVSCAPGVEPCYPYFFGNHSLRLRDRRLYDSTFDRVYAADTVDQRPPGKGPLPPQDQVPHPDGGPVGLSVSSLGQEDLFFASEVRMRYAHSGYGQWGFYDLLLPAPADVPVPTEGGIHFTGQVDFEPLYPTAGGYWQNLEAEVQVLVLEPDEFYFKGVLTKGDQVIAHRPDIHTAAITDSVLHAEGGLHTIHLTFSGEEIYRSGKNGPWELKVSVQSPHDTAVIDPIKVHSFERPVFTPDYQYGEFGQQPAHMTGQPVIRRIMAPGGQRIEALEIGTKIFVREKGRYAVEGRLSVAGRTVAYAGNSRELDTGDQQLTMKVLGKSLHGQHRDGEYALTVNLFGSRQIVLDSWHDGVGSFAAKDFARHPVDGPSVGETPSTVSAHP